MPLIQHIEHLDFKPDWNRAGGWCDVKVYEHAGAKIAIATDPISPEGEYLNEGVSLTNGIEYVAHALHTQGIEWGVLIEYLPERGQNIIPGKIRDMLYAEDFARVTFKQQAGDKYGSPDWEYMTRAEVSALIGEEFSNWHGR